VSIARPTSGSAPAGPALRPHLGRRLAYFSPAAVIVVFLLIAPTFLAPDLVHLLTKIVIFALFAMSLDLVFGYSGLWSFGHAGLFAAAAYSVAILVSKVGVTSFWVVAPVGVGVSVITAALFGVFGLRSRDIYFMLITFAFGELISVAARTSYKYTGGSNGIWDVPFPNLGFGPAFSKVSYYYFALIVVAIAAVLLYLITKSPFGHSLMGIRDNEVRAKTLGYNTWLRRFLAFVLSGFFAGVAGVLYVFLNRGISPDQAGISNSGLVIMMVIIGGVGTLWGGAIGSAVIIFLNYIISLYTPSRWPLFLGALFIAAVFFAKGGIYPRFVSLWKRVCGYDARGGRSVERATTDSPPDA
jgi:branched-chain amino acid transport system permease protein